MPTNQQVFNNGSHIDQWSCDVSFETGECESNGSDQVLVQLDNKLYLIIMKHDNSAVREPGEEARRYLYNR